MGQLSHLRALMMVELAVQVWIQSLLQFVVETVIAFTSSASREQFPYSCSQIQPLNSFEVQMRVVALRSVFGLFCFVVLARKRLIQAL